MQILDQLTLELGWDVRAFLEGAKQTQKLTKDQREDFERHSRVWEGAIAGMGKMLASLAAAFLSVEAAIKGLETTRVVAQTGTEMKNFADAIGMSVEQLSQWEQAMERIGGRKEDIRSMFQFQQQELMKRHGPQGGAPSFLAFAQRLGIDTEQFYDPVRKGYDLDRFNRAINDEMRRRGLSPTQRTQYLEAFGARNAAAQRLFEGDLAANLGRTRATTPTQANIAAFQRLNELWAQLSQTAEAVGRDLVTWLEKPITRILLALKTVLDWLRNPPTLPGVPPPTGMAPPTTGPFGPRAAPPRQGPRPGELPSPSGSTMPGVPPPTGMPGQATRQGSLWERLFGSTETPATHGTPKEPWRGRGTLPRPLGEQAPPSPGSLMRAPPSVPSVTPPAAPEPAPGSAARPLDPWRGRGTLPRPPEEQLPSAAPTPSPAAPAAKSWWERLFGGSETPAKPTPQFQAGTPYVPETGLALVHRGERIVPADQNRMGRVEALPSDQTMLALMQLFSGVGVLDIPGKFRSASQWLKGALASTPFAAGGDVEGHRFRPNALSDDANTVLSWLDRTFGARGRLYTGPADAAKLGAAMALPRRANAMAATPAVGSTQTNNQSTVTIGAMSFHSRASDTAMGRAPSGIEKDLSVASYAIHADESLE